MKILGDLFYLFKGGLLPFLASAFGRTLHACKNLEMAKQISQNFKTISQVMPGEECLRLARASKAQMPELPKPNLNRIVMLGVGAMLLASCAQAPTKVYESKEGFSRWIQEKTQMPLRVTEETIVVDARSRFDYTMAHYPGSSHLMWESFSQTKGLYPGRLIEDLEEARKRLEIKGLHPKKPIVIVGYGLNGQGEAGRLAWTLFYLGFDDVQIVGDRVLKASSNIVNSKPSPNAKPWTLKTRPQLISSKKQVLEAVTKRQTGPRKVFLFDVRSKDEYFKKEGVGKPYTLPDLGAIHVEWKEFFNKEGRPSLKIKNQLRGLGIGNDSRIIVLSNNGVRSAAATAALVSLGYKKASNFVDGLESLKK